MTLQTWGQRCFVSEAEPLEITDFDLGHPVHRFLFQNINYNNRNAKADVELWDISGNPRYKTTWPALAWELHGLIFVFSPEIDSHGDDLNMFYENFAKKAGIPDTNCIVFAHVKDGPTGGRRNVKLSKNFSRIPQLEVNIEEEGNGLRADFQRFVGTLATNISEKREQVEMNIMRH